MREAQEFCNAVMLFKGFCAKKQEMGGGREIRVWGKKGRGYTDAT